MFTGTMALLQRALKLDARLWTTHGFRFGFALLVYFSLIYAQIESMGLKGAPGLRLFSSMAYLNLGLICLAGVSFFATAITEEKEEETLGLLKMAGINPLGLLLGKSTSRLIGTLVLLAVQFPFTLLAVTLGGATQLQVLSGYVALASFLILTANVGLFCSVACRRGGTASAFVIGFYAIYFLLPYGVGPLFSSIPAGWLLGWQPTELQDAFIGMSAFHQLNQVLSTGFVGPIAGWQVISNLGLAALFFVVSWMSFNYYTSPKRQNTVRRDIATVIGSGIGLRRPRPRAGKAIMWKEYHFVTGGTHFLVVRFIVYGLLVGSAYLVGKLGLALATQQVYEGIVYLLLGCFVIEGCLYASRLLHDEWREHTLPMLMMLPVPVHRILASKLLGCVPALIPVVAWTVIMLFLWDEGITHLINVFLLPSYWFGGLVFLLLLTLTLFFSLVVRWGALPMAIGVMMGAVFFGGCCFFPVVILLHQASGNSAGLEAAFLVIDGVVLLLIAGLQFDIHRRIEIAGAQ